MVGLRLLTIICTYIYRKRASPPHYFIPYNNPCLGQLLDFQYRYVRHRRDGNMNLQHWTGTSNSGISAYSPPTTASLQMSWTPPYPTDNWSLEIPTAQIAPMPPPSPVLGRSFIGTVKQPVPQRYTAAKAFGDPSWSTSDQDGPVSPIDETHLESLSQSAFSTPISPHSPVSPVSPVWTDYSGIAATGWELNDQYTPHQSAHISTSESEHIPIDISSFCCPPHQPATSSAADLWSGQYSPPLSSFSRTPPPDIGSDVPPPNYWLDLQHGSGSSSAIPIYAATSPELSSVGYRGHRTYCDTDTNVEQYIASRRSQKSSSIRRTLQRTLGDIWSQVSSRVGGS